MIYMEKLREMGILIALITTTMVLTCYLDHFFQLLLKVKSNKKRSEKDLTLLHLHN